MLREGEAIGSTTANDEGAFVLVPEKPLPAGSGALTIESKGKPVTKDGEPGNPAVKVERPKGNPVVKKVSCIPLRAT